MPEYLAPGVYVEETSFRAKSIEGVSTSTTAFIGPTRKGPIDGTPELLTSFGDFQRIYGGLEDLESGPNYVALAAHAYFENGGSRLYISRVYPQSGNGRASGTISTTQPTDASFVARFPGAVANGTIHIHEVAAPATARSLTGAATGSVVRVNSGAAGVTGGTPPFTVPSNGTLYLTVNGTNSSISLHGDAAEIVGTPLAAPLTLTDATKTLTVRTDPNGPDQTVTLTTTAPLALTEIVSQINAVLQGATARVTTAADAAGANALAIDTTRKGKRAWLKVSANATLGFAADQTVDGSANASNTVNDLGSVTVGEIDGLLRAASIPVRATTANGRLKLMAAVTGTSATLSVNNPSTATDSIHAALGLTPSAGPDTAYYLKGTDGSWKDSGGTALDPSRLSPAPGGSTADILTLTVAAQDQDLTSAIYDGLGFDRTHPRWVGTVLAPAPTRHADAVENLYAVTVGNTVTGLTLRQDMFPDTQQDRDIPLANGSDATDLSVADYEDALQRLATLDDISILSAPGHSALSDTLYAGVQDALIAHVEQRRSYQIAVLDSPPGQTINDARMTRSRIDSSYAALYYPWVVVANPLARPSRPDIPAEITVPPSGFVCGIYARTDVERGVFKAPANEVVLGALRLESDVNFAQQEVLNPIGINCLRFFPNRGYRVWGARTASSDPEWKYVNIRRYFNYLEKSIDLGTQWAVFEPNGERLWANVTDTIASFLYNEWINGALLGSKPAEAFFVRCDRSTMTQNDLDNGRLVCLVGVAPLTPAEFVIFRIGQKTADARA